MSAHSTILGDWGSTHLRLWSVSHGTVRARFDAPGLFVAKDRPAHVLAEALRALAPDAPPQRIVLCGMAGAREGLVEAPYLPCPASLEEWLCGGSRTQVEGIAVEVMPGVSFRAADGRPDVMRGEEAQIFGALALRPVLAEGRRTFVLPGTHSKWVVVEDARITGLRTFATGELRQRLLGSSLTPADDDGDGEGERDGEGDGMRAGIARILSGSAIDAALFEARAARLLDGRSTGWSRGFLSGLLTASEIRFMAGGIADDEPVMLVGDAGRTGEYAAVLGQFGIVSESLGGEDCVLKGLELADARYR